MARINLRNHLLEMGFTNIGCYNHGRELKGELKKRKFDLLLMDYHLGQNKNGVEVVQDLQKEGLLSFVTSIIFITSDRMPMIIGQIVDVHPDALVLKPYTIRNLEKTLNASIKQQAMLMPVFEEMDKRHFEQALTVLDTIIRENASAKLRTTFIKLRARILIKLERFNEAASLYQGVLKGSDKIIWAKWGLIQCRLLSGENNQSENMLKEMTNTSLTREKACEWLTRICIQNKKYEDAEDYISQIKENDLSLTGIKLKTNLYIAQDKMDDAINLLERKRESNRNIRERFNELTLDLASCYLHQAEKRGQNERAQSLQVARFLIGSAGRKNVDDSLQQKRDYMNALVAILEGNPEKAKEFVEKEGMDDFTHAEMSTMADAAKAWLGLGNDLLASEILLACERRLDSIQDESDKVLSSMLINKSAEALPPKRERAVSFNKRGMDHYLKKRYQEAIDFFYQAHTLFMEEPAFALNLLQCLVELKLSHYKLAHTIPLLEELKLLPLKDGNDKRLANLSERINSDPDSFKIVPVSSAKDSEVS